MKKKTKDIESTLYCFLFIFILIFIFEVPRKAFNILRLDFNERLSKSYDYCSERAVGFLLHIKKKHKINHPPKFIKYTGVRNPGWVFFNRKVKNRYYLCNYIASEDKQILELCRNYCQICENVLTLVKFVRYFVR